MRSGDACLPRTMSLVANHEHSFPEGFSAYILQFSYAHTG